MSSAGKAVPAPTTELLTQIPSSLKQLARLVVRGFYAEEDALIVDMLVRHPCMREDDISALLKFDKKMVRARVTILKNDKFIQAKQRIETDEEGKVVKMNCYFINFRTFVNILKYKLDHMRKRMETSERDQTSRSSFKCLNCDKNFTDLEANQLLEPMSGEMRCTYCSGVVDEDEASGPQQDSRKLLAQFNHEMKPLYELLHQVETINLAPDLLEPEPIDLDVVTGKKSSALSHGQAGDADGGKWSGEATRSGGFKEEFQRFEVAIGDEAVVEKKKKKNEVPVWITRSALGTDEPSTAGPNDGHRQDTTEVETMGDDDDDNDAAANDTENEISLMLLRHERKAGDGSQRALIPGGESDSDKSDDSELEDVQDRSPNRSPSSGGDGDEGDGLPTVRVGREEHPITDVTEEIIGKMTPDEKEKYTQAFQDFYAHMYE